MDAYFINTVTRDRFNIKYLEMQLDGGGLTATYNPLNIPGTIGAKYIWQNTTELQRRLNILMNGSTIQDDYKILESFTIPVSANDSPPIVLMKIGELEAREIIVTRLNIQYDLENIEIGNNRAKFNRALVVMEFNELRKFNVNTIPVDSGQG